MRGWEREVPPGAPLSRPVRRAAAFCARAPLRRSGGRARGSWLAWGGLRRSLATASARRLHASFAARAAVATTDACTQLNFCDALRVQQQILIRPSKCACPLLTLITSFHVSASARHWLLGGVPRGAPGKLPRPAFTRAASESALELHASPHTPSPLCSLHWARHRPMQPAWLRMQ